MRLIRRVWCRLWGCYTGDFPCCERCGEELYGGDFIENGPAARFRWWARGWVRPLLPRRCLECGRRLWPWQAGYNGDHCSEACFDRWLPF